MANHRFIKSTILFLMLSTFLQIHGQDDPPDIDTSKCGGCPCDQPCNPPPSPPPPSPKPKPPPTPTTICPPPPSGGGGGGGGGGGPPSGGGGGGGGGPNPPYIYVNGPPGNLYPIDHYISGSGKKVVGLVPFWIIISSGLWLLACV